MVLPRGTNRLLTALVLLLVAGLAVLATLQYRWIDQVSDAERQRMRGNLDFAARHVGDDLRAELEPLFRDFSEEEVAQAYADTTHREWIAAVYVAERDRLQRFDPATGGLHDVEWPAMFDPIRERGLPPPFIPEIPAIVAVRRDPPGPFSNPGPRMAIVQLSRATLASTMPRLIERHFPDAYDVALVSGDEVLYRSTPSFPNDRMRPDAELELPLFGGGGGPPRDEPHGGEPRFRPFGRGPRHEPRLRLVVRRRDGGMDAVVAAARRRNLAISFGILFILGATIALLLALLRRADRLQQQQTEFVAAISHELNTPVAALRSAGENLKDGLVADRDRLVRYGESIVRESARLGDMIGQVLEFAGMQSRNARRNIEPVDVASVIDDAVAQCGWLVAGTPIRIETNVDANVPPALGDASAFTRAVQNLVANAIRHGGSGNFVGVRASANGNGIAITVEDRGPGIDHRDAAHLFEPFYRGRNSGSVRGSGLGLAIVKHIVDAHGGSITIDKRRGGAALTIHLPAAVEHA